MPTERSKMAGRRHRAQEVRAVKKILQGKSRPRIAESGMALATIGKTAVKLAQKYGTKGPSRGKSIGSSVSGGTVPRTKAAQKYEAIGRRETNKYVKEEVKRGTSVGRYGSVSARAQSVSKKPSARQMSSKRRGKK